MPQLSTKLRRTSRDERSSQRVFWLYSDQRPKPTSRWNVNLTAAQLRHSVHYTLNRATAMPKETKLDRLRHAGVLNPRPEAVRAPWFERSAFFDPNDLVQVKYEMLRHARQEGVNKAEAAALFGLSRPTFYQAEAAFERDGIAGLLPRTRGPKSAHKLTDEVMLLIIEQHHQAGRPLQARSLAALVQSKLGLSVHPRSIERALARKKKR
jgi:transposase